LPRPPSADGRCLGLDLLRMIAVMMVLLSHWLSHFSYWFGIAMPPAVDIAGDIGVEIFFALSGFLIGRILIGIIAGRPTWGDYRVFMIRRGMRTLPLYFLWLTLLLCLFPPNRDALVTAFRFLTLTQNLVTELPPDYYFAVTWSLSIEEWFYLLFGAGLVMLARRFAGRRALVCCLGLFMLIPLALRLFYLQRGALVFFRIDEIAYGVLMARLYLDRSRLFDHPWTCLTAGVALIGGALFSVLPLPQILAVPLTSNAEVIGGALCLPAALRFVRAPWLLELPVRWIASRSYALYLIHLTILFDVAEVRLFEPGLVSAAGCAVIAIVVPFLLAEVSYRFLESPLLRLRPTHDRVLPRQLRTAAA
jgi:peptidoglycan/LPS O-acetylase OafA/YrhL